MRVFIGLSDVSGFYFNLCKGFSQVGVDAELITLTDHPFEYGEGSAASKSFPLQLARWSQRKRRLALRGVLPVRFFWLAIALLCRVVLFIWALARFDIFILSCGTSFFRFGEFPILKVFRKKIIYVFHGTDDRPAFLDGFAEDIFLSPIVRNGSGYIPPLSQLRSADDIEAALHAYKDLTVARRNVVKAVERYADFIVSNPASAHHHSRPFIISGNIGVPFDRLNVKSATNAQALWSRASSVKILHCPSHPLGKGSHEIREVIHALQVVHPIIEYKEITGRPNHEVLALIQGCDFVVDQLYSDTPMAGFATEAAFLGKPAVVSGYYAPYIQYDYGSAPIPPTAFCEPTQFAYEVRRLVLDESYRQIRSQLARAFVEQHWTAKACAEQYRYLLDGTVPNGWYYDPAQCQYIGGMGMSEERLRHLLHLLLKRFGADVFCLSDKPNLLKNLIQFATTNK